MNLQEEPSALKKTLKITWVLFKVFLFYLLFAIYIIGPNAIYNFYPYSKAKFELTMRNMGKIKRGLIFYKKDLGRFPHMTNIYNPSTINEAEPIVIESNENNVLNFSHVNVNNFSNLGIPDYLDKWQGPYLHYPFFDYYQDSWHHFLKYECHGIKLYIHSIGPDGIADIFEKIIKKDYQGDDILLEVGEI